MGKRPWCALSYKVKLLFGITAGQVRSKEVRISEESGVCLQEEVERLRRSGMSTDEIAERMGVDPGWVESLVLMAPDESEDR
jgi:hypothetical protein